MYCSTVLRMNQLSQLEVKTSRAAKRTLCLPPETYYKRILPSSCISFDSERGKVLFRQALDENNMESYFPLSMQFLTQSEPAYCGLGTLCMVLNASGVDPGRKWKGPWYLFFC